MSPLHTIGDFFRALLLGVPPALVRGLFVALPVVLLVWVLTLPRDQTVPPGRTVGGGENLKFWAALALLIQICIYSLG